jgi:predicted TIM-barrel fold metal-dependent hydrolase
LPADWVGDTNPPWIPASFTHPATDEELMSRSLEELKRYNVVRAIASGPLEHALRWAAASPGRIIASPMVGSMGEDNLERLGPEYRAGKLGAMGEITWQYDGLSPSDPAVAPFLALGEKFDIPVGIHMGLGPPGVSYDAECCPEYRARFGSPMLLEDALIRHPKLRVYMMHAGWPMIDETIAVMHAHPQLYADLAVINWYVPRPEFHAYLRRLVDAGLGKRLMFGSDQMVWPEAIGLAVEGLESASFLTDEQKRDIFYNNAARFLRLSEEEIAEHHGNHK